MFSIEDGVTVKEKYGPAEKELEEVIWQLYGEERQGKKNVSTLVSARRKERVATFMHSALNPKVGKKQLALLKEWAKDGAVFKTAIADILSGDVNILKRFTVEGIVPRPQSGNRPSPPSRVPRVLC